MCVNLATIVTKYSQIQVRLKTNFDANFFTEFAKRDLYINFKILSYLPY